MTSLFDLATLIAGRHPIRVDHGCLLGTSSVRRHDVQVHETHRGRIVAAVETMRSAQ
jgi:hypothetical protein